MSKFSYTPPKGFPRHLAESLDYVACKILVAYLEKHPGTQMTPGLARTIGDEAAMVLMKPLPWPSSALPSPN